MNTIKKNQKTLISLVEEIVKASEDCELEKDKIATFRPLLKEMAKRYEVTEMQALFLALFINMFDDSRIGINDFARHFDCSKLTMLKYWDDLEALCARRFVRIRIDSDGDSTFNVPSEMMVAVRENRIYETPSLAGMTTDTWLDYLNHAIRDRDGGRMSYHLLCEEIDRLTEENPNLQIVRTLKGYGLSTENRVVLLSFVYLFLVNNDEHIVRGDIRDIVESEMRASSIARELETDKNDLMVKGLLEHATTRDGMAEVSAWKLTERTKREMLSETIYAHKDVTAGLTIPDSITAKQMYYNPAVAGQVAQLSELLNAERFREIQDRLAANGMRKGLACVFYGAPGTGKTETALQLAKQTGRPVKMVDIPNMRSKWVGETEKNIKAVFDDYRLCCENSTLAPILLFNEADAVLCRRNEGATGSVDKMENAMQNIILQEMETLEGIMIATTNLASNLDAAFERRFLYKIEFGQPGITERKHIWKAQLKGLSEEDALALAKKYNFSGGQIENIARKELVNTILSGEELSLQQLFELCDAERLQQKVSSIGFA